MITCHLGGDSSLCAVRGGESIDTSMGFSLQAGVPMTNRHGDLDAWIVPFMMEQGGTDTGRGEDRPGQAIGYAWASRA